MSYSKNLFIVAAAAALFGCGSADDTAEDAAAPAGDVTAAATQAADAATLCLFEEADTRNWTGEPNADQDVEVAGEVQVADANYTARLDRPEIEGEIARLWLSMAENPGGAAPAGGWHEVTATIEDSGAVKTVEIWCDMDTRLATFPVRR